MKKTICACLATLMLLSAAIGESAIPSPTPQIELITPTPSAVPLGPHYSDDALYVTLPYGFSILEEADRAAYDAAVESDYPDAVRMLMAATNGDFSAAASFACVELDMDAPSAAREAAQKILNSTVTVSDVQYGENSYSGFICAIGEQIYTVYYLSGEKETLIVSITGMEDAQAERMLTNLKFTG